MKLNYDYITPQQLAYLRAVENLIQEVDNEYLKCPMPVVQAFNKVLEAQLQMLRMSMPDGEPANSGQEPDGEVPQ